MIYKVRHRTTYTYENVGNFARCVIRLRPQDTDSQAVLETSISVEPKPSSSQTRLGPFGETTLTVIIEEPHDTFVVEANSLVDVHRPPVIPGEGGPSWEQVRRQSLEVADIGPDSPANFIYPTFRAPIVGAITEYGRLGFATGRPVMDAVADLMRRIHDDFTYDPEATMVSTPVAEAFEARHGVCQDFTHIMISALRGLGLPAAYVSGYIRTIPPPGKPRLEGADATHAWVQVWCGAELGWIGFDPTNDIFVQNDHIVIAAGRDYSDVAPIDGILLSPGDQDIDVAVDVIPMPDAAVVRPVFGARKAQAE